jgi:hypothetical protein
MAGLFFSCYNIKMSKIERNLPIYLYKTSGNYPITEMMDVVINLHERCNYLKGNSFPIIDSIGSFDKLYSEFFDIATQELGPLELDSSSIRTCWGYVTNKNFYKSGIHHHKRTSTINAVYYLAVPQTNTEIEGSLSFYNDSRKEIYSIKPKPGDLVMFPNYLLHQPHQSFTDDYRISVNMEIICKDVWHTY